jgi:DNA-binding MarR family transcriptional regulator
MKRSNKPAATAPDVAPITLQELLSYKIIAVANAMSTGSALRLRNEFDMSLGEWRALALIASSASHSLNGLARAASLDKGQMSRVTSSLVERGLVTRESGARKGIVVPLALTPRGRELYAELIGIAAERNDRFTACLTAQERTVLQTVLAKLFATAREYVRSAPPVGARSPRQRATPSPRKEAAGRVTESPATRR